MLDALGSHPDVWRHTVVLINYDENDGFFDHVPPPVPPADNNDERWQGLPTGLGVRVPMLVVSPWSVGGYVCSEVFDHTSVIRLLEKWTGVEEPNITPWRRAVTGDLTSAFDFRRGRPQPEVEQPGAIPPFTGRWRPVPPLVQHMPVQEEGTRPARPLPYQPDAYGRVTGGGGPSAVELSNSGRASAHFALYPYAGEFPVPQHKDVRGKAQWSVPLTKDAYRFTITGPNGFRREFAGSAGGAARGRPRPSTTTTAICTSPCATTAASRSPSPSGRWPTSTRPTSSDWTRTITVKPGRSRTVVHSAADAHGWYDIEVTADRDAGFRRRLMGHIENGRASVSG